MGVEYYLLDKTHREMLHLGRHMSEFGDIFRNKPNKRKIEEELNYHFLEDDDDSVWIKKFADVIFAFCCAANWDIKLANDCSDSAELSTYTEVYSRVEGIGSKGEYLKFTGPINILPGILFMASVEFPNRELIYKVDISEESARAKLLEEVKNRQVDVNNILIASYGLEHVD